MSATIRCQGEGSLKVLLRNRATGDYFKGPNEWTAQRDEAFIFEGSARAMLSARELPCDSLELLLVFDDPAHDLSLRLPRWNGGGVAAEKAD